MSRHDKKQPRDDSNEQDKCISQLFESLPQEGDILICDNCHADYAVRATGTDLLDQHPGCPCCAHLPQRYSLTRVRLEKVKTDIGWKTISDEARAWWNAIESRHADHLDRVLNLAQLLHSKSATINEFHGSYLQSGARKVAATLSFMDFQRAKHAEKAGGMEREDVQAMPELSNIPLLGIPAEAGYGFAVSLVTYYDRKLSVLCLVNRLTDLPLVEVKRLVERAPVILGRCATEADARTAVSQIYYAGGHAHVGECE